MRIDILTGWLRYSSISLQIRLIHSINYRLRKQLARNALAFYLPPSRGVDSLSVAPICSYATICAVPWAAAYSFHVSENLQISEFAWRTFARPYAAVLSDEIPLRHCRSTDDHTARQWKRPTMLSCSGLQR